MCDQDKPATKKTPYSAKNTSSAPHILTGKAGEDAALAYLTRQGFKLLARNWRPSGAARSLELDLVMEQQGHIIFVEVKTRNASQQNAAHDNELGPAANFTKAKRRNMVKAARHFLSQHSLWDHQCRFDLICVTYDTTPHPQLEHHTNVIEYNEAMDSGHASWQPW